MNSEQSSSTTELSPEQTTPISTSSRRRTTRRAATAPTPATAEQAAEQPVAGSSDVAAPPRPARSSRRARQPEPSEVDVPADVSTPSVTEPSFAPDAATTAAAPPSRSRHRGRNRRANGNAVAAEPELEAPAPDVDGAAGVSSAVGAPADIADVTAATGMEEEVADLDTAVPAEARPASKRRRRRGRGGRSAEAEAALEESDTATAEEVGEAVEEPEEAARPSVAASPAVLRRFDRHDWREHVYRSQAPARPARSEAPAAIAPAPAAEREERTFDRGRGRPRFEPAPPRFEPAPTFDSPVLTPVRNIPAAPTNVVARPAALTAEPASSPGRGSLEDRLEQLVMSQSAMLQQQGQVLESLTATLNELKSALARMTTTGIAAGMPRAGVFVDAPNILYAAESARITIDYGRMLDFLCRGREMVHAIVYAPVTEESGHRYENQRFVAPFLNKGYKLVTKPLKRFPDGTAKGNFDIELAIDIVTMSQRLDVVILISGDSDFSRLIELIQSRGVRVEVVAFASNVSWELVQMADVFIDIGTYLHEFRAT